MKKHDTPLTIDTPLTLTHDTPLTPPHGQHKIKQGTSPYHRAALMRGHGVLSLAVWEHAPEQQTVPPARLECNMAL